MSATPTRNECNIITMWVGGGRIPTRNPCNSVSEHSPTQPRQNACTLTHSPGRTRAWHTRDAMRATCSFFFYHENSSLSFNYYASFPPLVTLITQQPGGLESIWLAQWRRWLVRAGRVRRGSAQRIASGRFSKSLGILKPHQSRTVVSF